MYGILFSQSYIKATLKLHSKKFGEMVLKTVILF